MVVEGESSEMLPVVLGVPQGSVLGPLLLKLSEDSTLSVYADDIMLYKVIESIDNYQDLQSDIDVVEECLREDHLIKP